MRVLIVGAGTMGRWFAEVVSDWLSVTFADRDPDTATGAAAALDATAVGIEEAQPAEIVCTAVPQSVTLDVLTHVAPLADRAIVDLSGSMGGPVAVMSEYSADVERLSLHPLFAPENAPGNIAVVADNAGSIAEELLTRLEDRGHNPFETTPTEHDRAMETVQAKAHAAILAYALAAEPVDPSFHTPVSATLHELTTTVLGGTPAVYAEIQSQFSGADELAERASQIASADLEAFEQLYREAAERRSETG